MNRDNISRAIFTLLTIMYSFFLAASFKQEFGIENKNAGNINFDPSSSIACSLR